MMILKTQPQALAQDLPCLLLLFFFSQNPFFSSLVSIFGFVFTMERKRKESGFYNLFFLLASKISCLVLVFWNGRKMRRNGSYNGIFLTSKPRVKNPILTKCFPHPYLIISLIQSIKIIPGN